MRGTESEALSNPLSLLWKYIVSNWLQRLSPRPDAALRLFCFHHAGGSASTFRLWPRLLPEFDVCAVQLPGRANRFGEPFFTDAEALLNGLVRALQPLLDRPYALFGNSMGSAVAGALAQQLFAAHVTLPRCLMVAGRQAPHRPFPEESMRKLSDRDLVKVVQRAFGGLSAEALANQELIEMMLPTLRADLALLESFPATAPVPLPVRIVALGGIDDACASTQRLQTWQACTTFPLQLHRLPGSHFFVDAGIDRVLEILRAECGLTAARRVDGVA